MVQFSNPVVGGKTLVRQAIQSQNYVPGSAGWMVGRDGSAEFNNVIVRGGTVIEGVQLFYAGTPALGNLIGSIAAAAGVDQFGNAYLAGYVSYAANGSFVHMFESAFNSSAEIDFQPPNQVGKSFEPGFIETQSSGATVNSANLTIGSPNDANYGADNISTVTLSNRGGTGGLAFVAVGGDQFQMNTDQWSTSAVITGGNVEVDSIQTDSGTVTSTTYTGTRTGTANVAGAGFHTPAGGKFVVAWSGGLSNSSTTAFTLVSWEIRQGLVVGSGLLVQAATDNILLQHSGTTQEESKTAFYPVALSAFTDYNIRLMYRVTAGTGTINRPRVMILPLLG